MKLTAVAAPVYRLFDGRLIWAEERIQIRPKGGQVDIVADRTNV
jgi:hypothetical protein